MRVRERAPGHILGVNRHRGQSEMAPLAKRAMTRFCGESIDLLVDPNNGNAAAKSHD